MARRTPVQREKGEQAAIVQLLRAIGADVYVLGTRRSTGRNCPHCKRFVPNSDMSTRQTPGIPDLYALLPLKNPIPWRDALWVEVKAAGGRPSDSQRVFLERCHARHIPHILGGLDDVIAWLVNEGYLKETQVPYYRLRKEA